MSTSSRWTGKPISMNFSKPDFQNSLQCNKSLTANCSTHPCLANCVSFRGPSSVHQACLDCQKVHTHNDFARLRSRRNTHEWSPIAKHNRHAIEVLRKVAHSPTWLHRRQNGDCLAKAEAWAGLNLAFFETNKRSLTIPRCFEMLLPMVNILFQILLDYLQAASTTTSTPKTTVWQHLVVLHVLPVNVSPLWFCCGWPSQISDESFAGKHMESTKNIKP